MGLTCCHSVRVVLSSARATSLRSESELAVQNPEVFNVRANPGPAADAEGVFAQLFDLSPFPAVVSRLDDHTVLAVNLRTSELFGVPQNEAVGRLVTDYHVDPADRLRLADQIRGDGRVDNLRLQVRGPNGPFWALVSSRLVAWRGEPAILTVFQDISDQLAAQTALKASERRLAAQSDALTSLTTGYAHPNRQFDERLRSILAISAQALQVERLSMWRVDEERQAIRCVGGTTARAIGTYPEPLYIVRTLPHTSTRSSASASSRHRTPGPTRARVNSCTAT